MPRRRRLRGCLYVLLAAVQLAGGFVGDKALAVGEILHPERDLQQVVQLGAQPGIGAAATLLVLQQQGGFLFLLNSSASARCSSWNSRGVR